MNKEEMMRVLEKSLMRRLGEGIANAYCAGQYDDAKRLARVADWLMNGEIPTEDIAPESWNEQAKETVATIVAAIKRRKPRFVSRAMAKDIEYQEETE